MWGKTVLLINPGGEAQALCQPYCDSWPGPQHPSIGSLWIIHGLQGWATEGHGEAPQPRDFKTVFYKWTLVLGTKKKGRAHSLPTVTTSASSTGGSLRPRAPH